MNNLFSKIKEYSESDYYPFHMPGHKRILEGHYKYDITEIDGFDNLHNPVGIIKDIMDRVSHFYGSDSSYLLVNGSTCGIQAAISASVKPGEKILMARNCHKSVYNMVFLLGLEPVYIYPEHINEMGISGEITKASVEKAIGKHPDIKVAIITSPTYDGIVSDIKSISHFLHEKDIPLIVDEAHGAHLGLHPDFLPSALSQGADVVIQSIHKTLSSLTQTALIHLKSNIFNKEALETFLGIYQSSSPSYVLITSIERCVDLLVENAPDIFNDYIEMLKDFYKKCEKLKKITLYESPKKDITKLVISVKDTDITGEDLYNILLNEYHLQFEMKSGDYVLGITSFCDTQEGFDRLAHALFEIDKRIKKMSGKSLNINYSNSANKILSARDAFYREKETINIEDSMNKIAGEYKFMYPPGIPVVVPGELITGDVVKELEKTDKIIKVIKGEV